MEKEIIFPIRTLLPKDNINSSIDSSFSSKFVSSLISPCLEKLKPDIVAIPGWGFPVSRSALYWCKNNKVRSILMSESKWDDEQRSWWKELLKYWLYIRKYDAALVGGELHRKYLIKLGFSSKRIFLGYDVVDNNYFTKGADEARSNPISAKERQKAIPSKSYFISVTRFIKRKNVLGLIQAFAAYRQQIQEDKAWDLVICGSGEEESSIRNFISKKGLENCVHLPGFISYQMIGDWYGLARAFIHPALIEQWGLVVNEAMAAGLPVIVSNRCGCFEDLVLEGVNGFGFDPENFQQLTELMLKMSWEKVDLKKMGQASLEHIQKFSPEYFAQGLIQSIEYVLSKS